MNMQICEPPGRIHNNGVLLWLRWDVAGVLAKGYKLHDKKNFSQHFIDW
jgi:hypothetical protein